jgi:RNA polymerase sigma-70 factor (ECF subfamily)
MLETTKSPQPDDQYFAQQIQARLHSAVIGLSERQRDVFLLRHYEGMDVEEIGKMLGLQVGTVKAHMHRAVTKLRAELRDLYFSPKA